MSEMSKRTIGIVGIANVGIANFDVEIFFFLDFFFMISFFTTQCRRPNVGVGNVADIGRRRVDAGASRRDSGRAPLASWHTPVPQKERCATFQSSERAHPRPAGELTSTPSTRWRYCATFLNVPRCNVPSGVGGPIAQSVKYEGTC